jgi:succinate dehydrogenase / fumarate reductase membrane anchor subunit
MSVYKELRNPLKNARGLGSTHDGTHHWWMQRLTAVALVFFTLWLIPSMLEHAVHSSIPNLKGWLSGVVNAGGMILMIIALFYHAKLGLQIVIEDYVECRITRPILLIANTFFCYGAGATSILAILKLHFNS